MKNIIIVIGLLLTVNFCVSQTKKVKINNDLIKGSRIEYEVLKSDENIKQGIYQRISKGKIASVGTYTNNLKTGVWKVYNYEGEPEVEIDYDKGTIIYPLYKENSFQKINSIDDKLITSGDRPVINLYGTMELGHSLGNLLRYPAYARENNIMGRPLIEISVDENGNILDYKIKKSVHKSIDEEALRVIKLIHFEFLPAFKGGIPIKSSIVIPVNFQLA